MSALSLNWDGKESAICAADEVERQILDFDESLSYGDNSDNLIVQADNLAALKSLLPFYRGQVKCVYIDPPYNTGSAFPNYKDNFPHSEWLNMMYPRLQLLREFLSDDGAIFISINFRDEYHYLRIICDEIFDSSNYVGTLTWESVTQPTNSGKSKFGLQIKTEPILCYRNNADENIFELEQLPDTKKYPHKGKFGKCRFEIIEKSDAGNFSRPTMKFKILGQYPRKGKRWQIGEETARQLELSGKVEIVDGILKKAVYPDDEIDKINYAPFWSHLKADDVGTAQSGKELLNSIMGKAIGFDTVKPPKLIESLIKHLPKNSIVLDAFAGSGTTAHAVINLNKADGGNRKFILIEEKDYCQTITAERVKRIGGGYKFCRLGERLKVGGLINPAFTFEQLAAYVWFAATNTPSRADYDSPLLGIHEGKAIYYLHNETLTRRTFKELPAYDGEKIIYAAARRIGENFLKENRITFHSTREID